MDPKPESVRAIFDEACELPDPAEREAFIRSACADDAQKLSRVLKLLAAKEAAGEFLVSAVSTRVDQTNQLPGRRIGRYKLLQQIGEGGCGVVYMAEQEEPVRRKVALKIIKAGMDTKTVVARFEAERQALALMDHPNIAKFFDAGTMEWDEARSSEGDERSPNPSIPPANSYFSGRPYFVMELVRGVKITEYCDQHHLEASARLKLFIQICQAVQHAHQKGVIHRDLKPSNVLVTVNDGVPVPKIIDFGIAKATEQRLTDKTLFTAFEQFLGTPAYMSPEQAAMTSLDIDTRSDVYSLGVLLYELLTSRTPFDHKELLRRGLDELRRTLRETDPPKPSTRLQTLSDVDQTTIARSRGTDMPHLVSAVSGDLDWIVMKCLEKDRTRRYDTANGLARDVERFLANQPVSARPPSKIYALQKFASRNRTACATAALMLLMLLSALLYSSSAYRQESKARAEAEVARLAESAQRKLAQAESRRAEKSAAEARENVIRQYIANGTQAAENGSVIEALPWFAAALKLETDPRRIEMHQLRLSTSLRQAPKPTHRFTHAKEVLDIQFSPDLRWISTASRDKTARVWDLDRNEPATPPMVHAQQVMNTRFSKSGRLLLTQSSDRFGSQLSERDRGVGSVQLWNVPSAQLAWQVPHPNAVWIAEFNPDETLIVSACSDGLARLINARDGSLMRSLQHPREVRHATFSPDGRLLATCARDHRTRVWDVSSGALVNTFSLDGEAGWNWEDPRGAEFSKDSQKLISYHLSRVGLWEIPSGKEICLFDSGNPSAAIQSAGFSPNQSQIVAMSRLAEVVVRDAVDGKVVSTFRGVNHFSSIENDFKGFFTPDNRWILTWSRLGATLWTDQGLKAPISFGTGSIKTAAYGMDGRRIALGDPQGNVVVWDLISDYEGSPSPTQNSTQTRARLTPDGRRLITASGDGEVGFWNPTNGHPLLKEFPRHPNTRLGANQLELNRDGTKVLAVSGSGIVSAYDSVTGAPITPLLDHRSGETENLVYATFSSSPEQVITGDSHGTLRAWAIPGGRLIKEIRNAHRLSINAVVANTQNPVFATLGDEGTVQLWNAETLEPTAPPLQVDGKAGHASFSPDGKLLMIGCWMTGDMTLWRTSDASLVRRFPRFGECYHGGFSPDGKQYVNGWQDGMVRLWDIQTGTLIHATPCNGRPHQCSFSANSKIIAVSASSGLSLRDAVTGETISQPLMPDGVGRFVNGYDMEKELSLIAGVGTYSRIWNLKPLNHGPDQWELIVAAFSGKQVNPAGHLEKLEPAEAAKKLTAAMSAFPDHFRVSNDRIGNWSWRQAIESNSPFGYTNLISVLNNLIQQGDPDGYWKLRRASAKYALGSIKDAEVDHPAFTIPPRSPMAQARQIDLSPHFNSLSQLRAPGLPYNPTGEPVGLLNFEGVDFDVRGRVEIYGTCPSGLLRPKTVEGFKIGLKGKAIHVLQGTSWYDDKTTPKVASYVLHYSDGTTNELPVVYGKDVRNWWTVPGEPKETPNASVVWTGQNHTAARQGQSIRIWKRSYTNPRPDVEIVSIDFVSAGAFPAPFLLAMTVK